MSEPLSMGRSFRSVAEALGSIPERFAAGIRAFEESITHTQERRRLTLVGQACGLTAEQADEVMIAWGAVPDRLVWPFDSELIVRAMVARASGLPWHPHDADATIYGS